jgi:Heparinase II/III-like protein/Heparinase II/III N-terminus
MKTARLYFHTIIHLRPIQIYYQIFYKIRSIFRKIIGFKYPKFIPAQSCPIILKPSIPSIQSYFSAENSFDFLNQSQVFEANQINWNDEQTFGKLWAYHLNYFEFLNQENLTQTQGLLLIHEYINAYPTLKTGLEPYPTSLRGINWIKFLTKYQIQDPEIDGFLMAQYVQLSDNLEYHLMGNHLLENAFSLLFGAYYFKNEVFFKTANTILKTELPEQILSDGCHFERSVMYHQIVLFRLLDCLNLVRSNAKNVIPTKEGTEEYILTFYAQIMLNFLQKITFKNGDIPLVNDAANNIAPNTKQLIEYANQLNIRNQYSELADSNYRKFENNNYELVANVGNVSPDYLPAHSHNDSLSFVLYVNQKPFIVDAGISTYQNNEIRQSERSTAAHNTVQIGDFEQSEMWASFRVGRRAKTTILSKNDNGITASHDGYKDVAIIHERKFIADNQRVIIKDRIIGESKYLNKAYLHFHPDIEVEIVKHEIETSLGNIIFENIIEVKLSEYAFNEEFNRSKPAKVLTLIFEHYLTTTINFRQLP